MATSIEHFQNNETFLNIADLELKRAERYRVFVSLLVLDLSIVKQLFENTADSVVKELVTLAEQRVRCTDSISPVNSTKLALLFPETPRQSAMLAARRLTELMRNLISEKAGRLVETNIPIEIASYPDAAGAKTLSKLLVDLNQSSRN
jgi:GGDEF domain-containing protein